jgi:hypothetical protein
MYQGLRISNFTRIGYADPNWSWCNVKVVDILRQDLFTSMLIECRKLLIIEHILMINKRASKIKPRNNELGIEQINLKEQGLITSWIGLKSEKGK